MSSRLAGVRSRDPDAKLGMCALPFDLEDTQIAIVCDSLPVQVGGRRPNGASRLTLITDIGCMTTHTPVLRCT